MWNIDVTQAHLCFITPEESLRPNISKRKFSDNLHIPDSLWNKYYTQLHL